MDFLRYLLPNELEVLHNSGIFDYNLFSLGVFVLKGLLFPVTLICIGIFIYYLLFRPFRRYSRTRIFLFVICAVLISLCAFAWRPVLSKLCFARGYLNYLYDRNDRACIYYIKSFDLDNSFNKGLNELITIYKGGYGSESLLDEIGRSVERADDVDLYIQAANLFEEGKKYNRALDLYAKAKKKGETTDLDLSIVSALIRIRDQKKAEQVLRNIAEKEGENEKGEMFHYYKSLIEFDNKDYGASLKDIDKAIAANNTEPLYLLQKGRILARVGKGNEADRFFTDALLLRREFPQAYFEKARMHYERGDFRRAKEALIKALYFDNSNSLAYVMLKILEGGKRFPIGSITYSQPTAAEYANTPKVLKLKRGESSNIQIDFETNSGMKSFEIGTLEPYGFGVKCEKEKISQIKGAEGKTTFTVSLSIHALRSNEINLGHPWLINVVFVDLEEGNYQNTNLFVSVEENESEEGRILLVITEDHEQTTDFPHKDKTPKIPDIDPHEMKVDLIEKARLADEIANKYGIKWSHLIDIGSSFLRLKWVQDNKFGEEWNDVWNRMSSYLRESKSMGHDIQLHIHAYSIPGNKLFRQYYDRETKTLRFKDNIVRTDIGEKTYGAWAFNYPNLGHFKDANSKIGSIFQGIKLLEGELHKVDPNYMTIFFRAGEYEFGNGLKSTKESILALKQNNILAGSNAHKGIPSQRNFTFFKKLGNNVYFTKRDNIHQKTSSLLDIGVLEILPVPKINAKNYLQPTDHWSHVKYNYDLCFMEEKVKPGIFVILEMEHLHNINASHRWDVLKKDYGDWAKMARQFKQIKLNCPKIEPVTISEGIKIYLDYYSPDIIALRANEKKVNEKLFQYDLKFLGRDVELSKEKPHFVSITPPSYLVGKISRIEIVHNDQIVESCKDDPYTGIEFMAISKKNYKMYVYLK